MKKIRAWIIMGAACMAVILSLPEDYGAVMSYAGAGLMQFLWNLIPVFLCVGLMDVWVEKEKMIKISTLEILPPFFMSRPAIGSNA